MTTSQVTTDKSSRHTFINDISYRTLENGALIILAICTMNPFIKFLITSMTSIGEGAGYRVFWAEQNTYAFFLGTLVLVLYTFKLRSDNKLPNIKKFIKGNISLLLIGTFAILMTISTIINGVSELTLFGNDYRNEGLITYLCYIIYLLLAAFCLNDRLRNILLHMLALSSLPIGLATIYDSLVLDFSYKVAHGGVIFSQFNHFGYYLLMSVMTFALLCVNATTLYKKLLYCAGYAIMLGALIINDTFGCQIALLAAIIFICIVYSIAKSKFQPDALILLAVTAITYIMLYIISDDVQKYINFNLAQLFHDFELFSSEKKTYTMHTTGVSRMNLWNAAFKLALDKPIFGYGADTIGKTLLSYVSNDRCHCEYLNYAVSFGFPAAFIYIVSVFSVYLRGLRLRKSLTPINMLGLCAAFAYLVSAVIGNSMYYTTPFLFIMLGLGYTKDKKTI